MAFKFLKSQQLKVIEWQDNSKDTICYKFPMDGREIMYGSKLTVRESQVAIFMNKGEIADIFGPGMFKLETSNLPILTKLLSLPYGFNSPFFADVFFINTKQFINQKWGTGNPFTLRDPDFGTVRVRGFGTYSFKVDRPEVFLKQLLGTNSSFLTSDVTDYLRSMIISSISDCIAESGISALDLAANLSEFNEMAKTACAGSLKEIGLELSKLIVENLSFPEEVEKAIDTRASMGVLGDSMDTFMKYQSAQAIKDAANNEGGMSGVGMGLGTGIAIGEMMRQAVSTSTASSNVQPAQTAGKAAKEDVKFCGECGEKMPKKAKFCPSCGAKQQKENKCPECGAETSLGAKFCGECGTKLK